MAKGVEQGSYHLFVSKKYLKAANKGVKSVMAVNSCSKLICFK